MSFWDSMKWFVPISAKNQKAIMQLSETLTEREIQTIRKGIKQGKLKIGNAALGITICDDKEFYVVEIKKHDPDLTSYIEGINKKIEKTAKERVYQEISQNIEQTLLKFISPRIVGFEQVKEATILQLFSDEQVNILLLGDPGTGKTEIIRAVSEIAPISSFGLGSGVSGVGLTATVKGKEVQKGLLPMAHNGIACIDELNLIKKEDVAGLYNAMEKGYVTYDKGGSHFKFDAKVSVLATANPRYSQFLGKTVEQLKKELPFDAALLTRFHLIFFIKKPDLRQFEQIAKGILKQKEPSTSARDKSFIKEYISYAKDIKVNMPKEFEERIVFFSKGLKQDEKKFLVEVNPRLVVGLVRMIKAAARSELRDRVEEKDLKKVFDILKKTMYTTLV